MIRDKKILAEAVSAYEHYQDCLILLTEDVRFSDVIFENCQFSQENLSKGEWLDCQLIRCQLANHNFSDSLFYRCQFKNCQLLGADFSRNKWKNNLLESSRGDFLNLSESTLENTKFIATNLREAFFQACQFKEVTFQDCQLERSDFLDSKLKSVDFSSSRFETLIFSPELLKGATFDYQQAPNILQLLGLKLK